MKKSKQIDVMLRKESNSYWSAEAMTERGRRFFADHVADYDGTNVIVFEEKSNPIGNFAFVLDTERVNWDLVDHVRRIDLARF